MQILRNFLLDQDVLVERTLSLGDLPVSGFVDFPATSVRTFDGLYVASADSSNKVDIIRERRNKEKKAAEVALQGDNETGAEDHRGGKEKIRASLSTGFCTCFNSRGQLVRSLESQSRVPCSHSNCQAPYLLLFSLKNELYGKQNILSHHIESPEKERSKARNFQQNSGPENENENEDENENESESVPIASNPSLTPLIVKALLDAWK